MSDPTRPLDGTTLQLHHDRAPCDFVVDTTQPDRFKEAVVVVDHPFEVNSELVRASLVGGTTMPEPAPSVCARRNPSCNGWQRWRYVDGEYRHFYPVPLQVCKSERARWGRCCEKAASAWMHDPPSVGEVWALAEKRERQRDQAREELEELRAAVRDYLDQPDGWGRLPAYGRLRALVPDVPATPSPSQAE